jgi:hypothetical protein
MSAQPTSRPRVAVASTGADAELFEKLRIATADPTPKVVMRLAQGGEPHASLPDLRAGDRLLVSAELEVTADCAKQQSDCVGKPYEYAPNVETTVLLTGGASVATASPNRGIALRTRRRPIGHQRHHEVFVFDNLPFVVPAGGLPWRRSTWINVAISAANPKATSRDVLIIGQQNEGGVVSGDMSGISVIHLRPARQTTPQPLRALGLRATELPVVKGQRVVVYSQQLDGLRKGEQLAVRAKVNTTTAHLGYPARVKTEVLLSTRATSPDPGAEARRVTASPQICRGNGHNCLPTATLDPSRKVGVTRILKDANAPLYVNVVVVTGDPFGKAHPGHALNILDGGFLEVVRYPAELAG